MIKSPKRILVIEDDVVYAKNVADRLVHEGYSVEVIHDGQKGLDRCLETKPDVLTVDINLPNMSGMSIINNIRQDAWGETLPIIILTNLNPTDELVAGVLQHQPSYYLVKAETTLTDMVEKIKTLTASAEE